MKRMTWLVPAVLLAAGCNSPGASKTSTNRGDPLSYSAPNQNGSSRAPAARAAAPAAQPQPYQAPAYTPPTVARSAPTYVQPPPPPPTTYRPPVASAPATGPAPAPYTPPPVAQAPVQVPAAPPTPSVQTPSQPQEFVWARTLAEAQASARATGRLVFLETGRDACGNCQNLKRKIVPEVSTALGTMSVGYYDDCDRDQGSPAFRILMANLPNALTLPLVGWVTPDLRWVHGYSGGRDSSRFRDEIATATARYRQMGAVDRPATGPALGLAPSTPQSLPDAELANIGPELLGEAGAPVPAPVAVTGPTPLAAPAADAAGSRSWAQAELRLAVEALGTRDYARARKILTEVQSKCAGEPEAREAAKGEVAIYNLQLIDRTPAEAAKVKEQAQRDLRNTVWAPLFG